MERWKYFGVHKEAFLNVLNQVTGVRHEASKFGATTSPERTSGSKIGCPAKAGRTSNQV